MERTIYLDCDGVILDTESGLFDEYYRLKKYYPSLTKLEYLENLDWYRRLREVLVLKDAINIMKSYDPKMAKILTGFISLNELAEKVTYFREKGVKNDIIGVPRGIKKCEIVDAYGNVLVDDNPGILTDWDNAHGVPLHFTEKESIFPKIDSLDDVLNPKKLEYFLNKHYR